MKDEYILALSVSHNSTAAVMRNGTIVSAVCEERSTRKKNFIGYPKNAIDYCLAKSGIVASELSRVAYTTIDNPGILVKAQTNTEFTLQDYRDYYGDKYYKKILNNSDTFPYLQWLRDDPQFNSNEQHFDFSYMTDDVLRDSNLEISLFRGEQRRIISQHLSIAPEKASLDTLLYTNSAAPVAPALSVLDGKEKKSVSNLNVVFSKVLVGLANASPTSQTSLFPFL